MINWKRVLRTAIQTGAGSGIALITAISTNYTKEGLISAGITFVTSVAIAILMNIRSQTEEEGDE